LNTDLYSSGHQVKVLDLCCYSGGFALNAAAAGADIVIGVDSAPTALVLAESNAKLNGLADRMKLVKHDVSIFTKEELSEGRGGSYDIVVLDPPKLAPSRRDVPRAISRYRSLNMRVSWLLHYSLPLFN
jgi:23S rRNA G2069 N7-methylase RlmK/C1962 C5-methylase RlmI